MWLTAFGAGHSSTQLCSSWNEYELTHLGENLKCHWVWFKIKVWMLFTLYFYFLDREVWIEPWAKPLQRGAVHLAIYMMIYFSEQAGYTLGWASNLFTGCAATAFLLVLLTRPTASKINWSHGIVCLTFYPVLRERELFTAWSYQAWLLAQSSMAAAFRFLY